MKIIRTANYKKLIASIDSSAPYDPYDESEEWSLEKEKEKYNDSGTDAINHIRNEIVPEAKKDVEAQFWPLPGESLELYIKRRVYVLKRRLNQLIELEAPQRIIDDAYKHLETEEKSAVEVYHDFKMDEARKKKGL